MAYRPLRSIHKPTKDHQRLVQLAILVSQLPTPPPPRMTLNDRIMRTFNAYRDRLNEAHLQETKGFRGSIWQGSFVRGQSRKTLAEFCETEGWTKQADADIWAGPTGKAKLEGSDITFIVYPQETQQ